MKAQNAAQGLTLALNAAEGRLQLALGCAVPGTNLAPGGKAAPQAEEAGTGGPVSTLYFAGEWAAQSQGAEILIPALQAALGQLKLEASAIGRVAVVNGPGGFTGLRLALASAAALSRALGAVQAGLAYLPLLAHNARLRSLRMPGAEGHASGTLAVLTHARSRLVYAQLFPLCAETRGPEPVSALRVLELKDLPAFLRHAPGPYYLAGSGASRNQAALRVLLAEAGLAGSFAGAYYDHVPPALLLEAALALPDEAYGRADIEPMYLRASDAEEGLEDIARKLGHNPEESRNRLNSLLRQAPENFMEGSPEDPPEGLPGSTRENAPESPDA